MSQEIKTPKNKTPFKLPLRVWLGYLLILSLAFTAVSLAKFATSGSNSDSARVASFAVSASTGGSHSFAFNDAEKNALGETFATTQTADYEINVFNYDNGKVSEVAISYDVIVTVPIEDICKTAYSKDELFYKGALLMTLDGKTCGNISSVAGSHYTFVFENVGTLPANKETAETHDLSITAYSKQITDDFLDIEFTVSVNFEQID